MWVDKFKPHGVQEIVGNESAVKRLVDWLRPWNAPAVKRDHNAVLLSGISIFLFV